MIHMAALSAFLQGISMEGLAKLRVVMVVWMATNNILNTVKSTGTQSGFAQFAQSRSCDLTG